MCIACPRAPSWKFLCMCFVPMKTADRKSTRLNSSHSQISYAVFCLKKKRDLHTCRRRTDDRQPFGHGAAKQPNESFRVQQSPGTINVSEDRCRTLLPTRPRDQTGQ